MTRYYAFKLIRIFLVAVLMTAGAHGVQAQRGQWVSHVDPSLISEIVLRSGELYLATSGGLLIYDPSGALLDRFDNTDGLPSNFLTALVFDNNDLWVGTENAGVARLRPTSGGYNVATFNSNFNGLSDDRINSVTMWGDTIVYGTENGAGLIIQEFPGQRFFESDGLPSDVVNDVLADGDRVWMATDSGVVYVGGNGLVNPASNGLPSPRALSFARTDTAMWVGTTDGVAYWDAGADAWVAAGLSGQDIFSLRFDGQVLWAGARRELHQNNGGGWTTQSVSTVFATYSLNNNISEMKGLQPMPGGIAFVGIGEPVAERRGVHLLRLDGTSFTNITFDGPPSNAVRRLSFDTDESLWASSFSFGVGKLTPANTWFSYNSASGPNELTNRFANLTMLADSRGSKWICTLSRPASPRSLDELIDGNDTDYGNDVWNHRLIGADGGDGLGSLRNVRGLEDPEGNIWLLSDDEETSSGWWGINILNGTRDEWRQVNPLSTAVAVGVMGSGFPTDVAFAPDIGGTFVALRSWGVQLWDSGGFTQNELFDFNGDGWSRILRPGDPNVPSTAEMLSIVRRSDGVLFVGTTAGLLRYDAGQITHIAANRGFGVGLLGDQVKSLVFDREENLWAATDLGLNRLARDNVFEIESFTTPVAWQTQLSLFFPPSVVSPLVDADCNELAMHPTNNLLYVATEGGLSVLDLSSLASSTTDLSLVYIYPNPVLGSRGDSSLKVGNINSPVNITIYNLEGELVHTARNVTAADPVVWDLMTLSGFIASSGVYLVRISDDSGTVVKTISLLR